MSEHPVLIAGKWRPAKATKTFQAINPDTDEQLPDSYPMSSWDDCDAALTAAAAAADELRQRPPDAISSFLTRFAERLEANKARLVELAHLETGLPASPRLAEVELPRTTNQLRQAADAARADTAQPPPLCSLSAGGAYDGRGIAGPWQP